MLQDIYNVALAIRGSAFAYLRASNCFESSDSQTSEFPLANNPKEIRSLTEIFPMGIDNLFTPRLRKERVSYELRGRRSCR